MKNSLLYMLLILLLGQTNSFAQCDPDITAPIPICVTGLNVNIIFQEDIDVWGIDFNANSSDACTPSNELSYFIELAPASPTPPSTAFLNFTSNQLGDNPVVLWVVDTAGNASTCLSNLNLATCDSLGLMACNDQVIVTLDLNNSYELDAFDMLEGGPYCSNDEFLIQLDQVGNPVPGITLGPGDIGSHLMIVQADSPIGGSCWGSLIVESGMLNENCPQLVVDIATNAIRPCFEGKYKVYYANSSVFPILDTHVEVTLNDDLAFVSSSIPETDLGSNMYRFETGDLGPGESGIFTITFFTDCDVLIGTTHCSEAQIFPDTICDEGAWSGAEVSVEGNCLNDTIYLSVKNIGAAANAQVLNYVVVEDVLMLTTNTFSLPAGEALNLAPIAASGATYRLEAEQEPGYPYGGMPSVSIEGCGGLNPGFVTLFPTQNSNPAISIHCRESTGSYDPNDKQALPKGYGAEHFIEKNTNLDYMIRFQNTGNDTAFNVVLIDTLSSFLNPQSLRMGAASHPYTADLTQGNILKISFNDILLPYKSQNEDGSQGWVQFAIAQQPDHPDGTVIENTAAIYFDFNAPIITNQTFHTVGSHFIATVATNEARPDLPQLRVYPNPGSDVLYFSAQTSSAEQFHFTLMDVLGRVVQERHAVTLPMTLQRETLETGTYFFQFRGNDGRALWSGKVMVR